MFETSAISAAEQAVIDAVPASIAVLDGEGVIIAINRAWREFSRQNGRPDASCDVGRPYVDGPSPADADERCQADDVAAGLRAVLSGAASRYTTVYNCPGDEGDRWFRMVVLRAGAVARVQRVIVLHRLQADAPTPADIGPTADELALRWVGLTMRCAWCGVQVRDVLGTWRPAAAVQPSLNLSHGICPDCEEIARLSELAPVQGGLEHRRR